MLWSRKGDEEMNRILIAEDDASIANLIRTVLVDAGYRCTWAPDGEQAADLLEKESFDLALLDIMLPGVNGYDLLEYCKSLEVPVIFLTALGGVEDRVRGLRSGAEDYLPKPFALPELLARVETVLRRCGKAERLLTLEPDIEIDPGRPDRPEKRQPRGPDGQGVRSAPAVRAEPEHRPLPGPHI